MSPPRWFKRPAPKHRAGQGFDGPDHGVAEMVQPATRQPCSIVRRPACASLVPGHPRIGCRTDQCASSVYQRIAAIDVTQARPGGSNWPCIAAWTFDIRRALTDDFCGQDVVACGRRRSTHTAAGSDLKPHGNDRLRDYPQAGVVAAGVCPRMRWYA